MNFRFKLSRRLARIRLLAVFAGALVCGCKLTESGPVIIRVEGIDVTPARLSLLPSQSANLAIDILFSRDDSSAEAPLVWSTTGGVITNNWVVGGIRHVTYQSPAQAGDFLFIVTTVTGTPADTVRIAVSTTPVPVNAITVSPSTKTLAAGDTTMLSATLTDATGAVVVGRQITWSSSDAGVATVLESGFVRAMGAGTATITAKSEDHTATATITVSQP